MGVQRDTRVAGMQREGLPLRRGRNRDATLAVMQTEEGVPGPGPGKYVKSRLVDYFWGRFLEQVFSSAAVLTVSRIEKCHFQGLLIALRIERWRSTTRAPCFIPLYTGLHTRTHIHICICEQALFWVSYTKIWEGVETYTFGFCFIFKSWKLALEEN